MGLLLCRALIFSEDTDFLSWPITVHVRAPFLLHGALPQKSFTIALSGLVQDGKCFDPAL